jgi:hypothetical protein
VNALDHDDSTRLEDNFDLVHAQNRKRGFILLGDIPELEHQWPRRRLHPEAPCQVEIGSPSADRLRRLSRRPEPVRLPVRLVRASHPRKACRKIGIAKVFEIEEACWSLVVKCVVRGARHQVR